MVLFGVEGGGKEGWGERAGGRERWSKFIAQYSLICDGREVKQLKVYNIYHFPKHTLHGS